MTGTYELGRELLTTVGHTPASVCHAVLCPESSRGLLRPVLNSPQGLLKLVVKRSFVNSVGFSVHRGIELWTRLVFIYLCIFLESQSHHVAMLALNP